MVCRALVLRERHGAQRLAASMRRALCSARSYNLLYRFIPRVSAHWDATEWKVALFPSLVCDAFAMKCRVLTSLIVLRVTLRCPTLRHLCGDQAQRAAGKRIGAALAR
eukprot:137722-Rhodomonas_salina.3